MHIPAYFLNKYSLKIIEYFRGNADISLLPHAVCYGESTEEATWIWNVPEKFHIDGEI